MSRWVAAIDCGTSTIKAGVFDMFGRSRSVVEKACPCIYRSSRHIEQDPALIIAQAFASLKEAVRRSGVPTRRIAAVSVSSQRATVLPVDRKDCPIRNAISWQDMRGIGPIEDLRRKIKDRRYYQITGLPNNPVFTLAKVLWLKKCEPSRYRGASKFVLVHDFLLKQLGAPDYFCDESNASLTGLLDVSRRMWSRPILELAGLSEERLPKLVPSGKRVGAVSKCAARKSGLAEGTPIVSGGGDQQCAGIGAGAVEPGILEVTLGTAAVTLCFSDRVRRDPKMRIACCAHAVPGKWEVEGLQNSAAASLAWFRRMATRDERISEPVLREISRVKPGAGGILFFPFLAGSSAPHWNAEAKAMFFGLTHAAGRADMMRAVMEGVSMETREILDVFSALGIPVRKIRLTGGASSIDVWNQIQADIYDRTVSTLENPHASLAGAAILAACGAGLFRSVPKAAKRMVRIKKTYAPNPENVLMYRNLYGQYSGIYSILEKKGVFRAISAGHKS